MKLQIQTDDLVNALQALTTANPVTVIRAKHRLTEISVAAGGKVATDLLRRSLISYKVLS